jgi:PAS domain S-box-containing protein
MRLKNGAKTMTMTLRILVLEDHPNDAELEIAELEEAGYTCDWERVETREDFLARLDGAEYDLILSDYSLPAFDGLTALSLVMERKIITPFILVSGTLGEETAIESLKSGATDYVLKNRLSRLGPVVRRALAEQGERRERQRAEENLRESERKRQRLFETMAEGVFYQLADGTLTDVNNAALQMFGLSREDFLNRTSLHSEWDVIREDGTPLPGPEHPSMQALHTGKPIRDLVVGIRNPQTQTYTWVSTNGIPEFHEGESTPYQVFVTMHDLTKRKQAEEALQASESLYRSILDASPDGIVVLDTEGRSLMGSPGLATLFGLDPEQDLSGLQVKDFIVPEDLERAFSNMALIFQGDQHGPVEYTSRRADGTRFEIEVNAEAIGDTDGKPTKLIAIIRDISERKQAEEELRKRESLLQKIFDLLPVGLWIADKDGKLLRGNPAGVKIWGAEPHVAPADYGVFKARSLPSREEIAPEDWSLVRTIQEGATIQNELLEIDAFDGVTRTILNSTAPVLDEQGEIQGAIIVNLDITDLKQIEKALTASEAKSRSILDNIGIGVALISPDMEILELNHQMQEWFPDTELGRHPICYRSFNCPPREEICVYCPTVKTLKDGQVHEAHAETPTSDGMRKYRIVSSPILDAEGQVTAAIELVEDVTEKSALENQLLQAQKMESVGRLAGGVAHDFNNMLGVILGHAEMALELEGSSSKLQTNLNEIRKAAERSANLTRQLLAFARKQTVSPKVVDLNEAIGSMFNMLRRLIGENIQLDWHPGTGLWPVRMDPSQIDQIAANLCVNARDAIDGVGTISIETKSVTADEADCATRPGFVPGDFVCLTIRDTGAGMDQETLSHIFEPFFTTKGLGEGTGLGLATVFGAVKQNNGFVFASSEPGEGTTFEIYLPRYAATDAPAPHVQTDPSAQQGDETILLVEDEVAILEMTAQMLEQLGYTVLAASTPGEAIQLARDHSGGLDLLLTDVIMPEMNGRDLAKNILAMYPDLKRLFMSGYTADVIAHQGVLDPGVHFIQKPFNTHSLTAKIRETLDAEKA